MFCFLESSVCKDFPWCSVCKESTCDAADSGSIPRSGRSPGEGKATHSSILAWEILWTEDPGGLQSMRSQRAGHDWSNLACDCIRVSTLVPMFNYSFSQELWGKLGKEHTGSPYYSNCPISTIIHKSLTKEVLHISCLIHTLLYSTQPHAD